MRALRTRFTMRGMMIAVAIIAFACVCILHTDQPQPVKATSSDPNLAARQEKVLHGVLWGMSYGQAREVAEREGRPILIFFSSIMDMHSRKIEVSVLPRTDVVAWLSRFVTVQLHVDRCPIDSLTSDWRKKLCEENLELLEYLTRGAQVPQFVVLDSRGNLAAMRAGLCEPWELIDFLKTAGPSSLVHAGKPRFTTWYVWVSRSLLFAVICLIVFWHRGGKGT